MNLRKSGVTYSPSRPFSQNKQRIQKFKETGESRYIYQNKLDRACFQHDMVYVGIWWICLEEKLLIKYYVIKHWMMDINGVLLQRFTFFYKTTSGGADTLADKSAIKSKITTKQQVAEELHQVNNLIIWKTKNILIF